MTNMTTKKDVRCVATGMSTPRTWLGIMGWFSFVGIVATVVLIAENGLAQPTAASWPFYRHDAALSGRASVEGPTIPDLYWVKAVGAEKIQSPVVTPDGKIVFISRGDNYVYALRGSSEEQWRFSHQLANGKLATFSTPPTISNNTIYVGSEEGEFFAINLDGTLQWKVTLGGYVGAAANIDGDGNIYVTADDAQLYVLNSSGKVLCVGSLDGLKPNNTPAIVSNSRIYVAAGNSIFVFDRNCSRIARWVLPNLGEAAWVVSNAAGDVLYAGSVSKSQVIALNAQNGTQLWSYAYDARYGHPSQPALGPDGTIYFAGFDAGLLVALNPNGKEKWTHDQGNARYKTMPVVDSSGDIYIVNEALGLAAFSPDKKLIWNLPNVQCKYSPAFGPDGTIYIPSLQKIYAVRQQPPYGYGLDVVSGNDQSGCIDSPLPNSIVVQVKDQYGNFFQGQPVRFRAIKGGVYAIDTTDARGIASIVWTLGSVVGEQQLEISSPPSGQPLVGSPILVNAVAVGPKIDGASIVFFDTTAVNDSSDTTYTISNPSNCILIVNRLDVPAPFYEVPPFVKDTPIPPHDSIVVRLRFAPTDSGTHSRTMQIYSNDAMRPSFPVALQGEATKPSLVAVPNPLSFGKVCLDNRVTVPVTILNNGNAPLNIDSIKSDNPAFIVEGVVPPIIPPNGSIELQVTFSPKAAKLYNARLLIYSKNLGENPFAVKLQGEGIIPKVVLVPEPPAFEVCANEIVDGVLNIKNDSDCELRVDSIRFAIVTTGLLALENTSLWKDAPASLNIGPHQSLPFAYSFQAPNKNFEVHFRIRSNGVPDPATVTIPGTVLPPQIAGDQKVEFDTVTVGNAKMLKANIWNAGKCDIRIDSVRIVGRDAFAFKWVNLPECQREVLLAGDSSCVGVEFHPKDVGEHTAELWVYSNDKAHSPLKIVLHGYGANPFPIIFVTDANFGAACDTTYRDVVISNKGQAVLSVTDLVFDNPAFFTKHKKVFEVNPGVSETVSVGYVPQRGQDAKGQMLVKSNATRVDSIAVLIGQGGVALIAGERGVDFGTLILQNCASDTSNARYYWIKNNGSCTLEISSLGTAAPFIVLSPLGPQSIDPGDSLLVKLAFEPKNSGTFDGTLRIGSNDASHNPFEVALHASVKSQAVIVVNPLKIDFGVACSDALQSLTIKNRGSVTLQVTKLAFAGSAFTTTHVDSFAISPCDSETVWVKYAPRIGQNDAGTLVIYNNDPNAPTMSVALLGKGGKPMIAGASEVRFPDVNTQNCAGNSNDTTQTYWIKNNGTCDLFISGVRTRLPFSIVSPTTWPETVKPGDSLRVTLKFAPQTKGAFVDTLFVDNNDPAFVTNPFRVVLSGEGIARPDIAVNPSEVVFDSTFVGKSSTKPLTIFSRGAEVLQVKKFIFSDSAFSTAATQLTLACGESSAIAIAFRPTRAGDYDAILTIVNNDPRQDSVKVRLRAHAQTREAAISLFPQPLDFGNVCIGSDATLCLTVKNLGSLPLVVNNWRILSGAGVFKSEVNEFQLAPGKQNNSGICVTFVPIDTLAYLGRLVIESNAPSSPDTISLVGRGESPHLSAKRELHFPKTGVNSVSAINDTLFNHTSCELRLDSLRIEGLNASEFKVAQVGQKLIPAHAYLAVPVTFAPLSLGQKVAQLKIWSNDLRSNPFVVQLYGEAPSGQLEIAPTKLSFDSTCVSTTKQGIFKLKNSGASAVRVTSISFRWKNDGGNSIFTVGSNPALPFTLGASDSQNVEITFAPTDTISYSADVVITFNTGHENDDEKISFVQGVGEPFTAKLFYLPAAMSFADIGFEQSTQRVLTLQNRGCEKLEITRLALKREGVYFGFMKKNWPRTLAKDEILSVTVWFDGRDFGAHTDTLSVFSNDEKSPLRIPLAGAVKSGGLCVSTEPDSSMLHFKTPVRSSVSRTFTFINCTPDTGAQSAVIDVSIRAPKFPFKVDPAFSNQRFPGGTQATLTITFTPDVLGTYRDEFWIDVVTAYEPKQEKHIKVELVGVATERGDEVVVKSNVVTPNEDDYNRETLIHYPEEKYPEAALHIFDLRGMKVRTFHRPTAQNEFGWDGKDENGGYVLPSVYIWILEDQGKRVASGRFVVIR